MLVVELLIVVLLKQVNLVVWLRRSMIILMHSSVHVLASDKGIKDGVKRIGAWCYLAMRHISNWVNMDRYGSDALLVRCIILSIWHIRIHILNVYLYGLVFLAEV